MPDVYIAVRWTNGVPILDGPHETRLEASESLRKLFDTCEDEYESSFGILGPLPYEELNFD